MTSARAQPKLPWRRRARSFIRRHRTLHLTWRLLVFIVGFAVLIAGFIMFVTPGPGWVAVIAGLAILSTEFAWAQRLLDWAKERAKAAKDKALDPRARRRNTVLVVLAAVAVIAGAAWWISWYGLPAPLADAWDWVLRSV